MTHATFAWGVALGLVLAALRLWSCGVSPLEWSSEWGALMAWSLVLGLGAGLALAVLGARDARRPPLPLSALHAIRPLHLAVGAAAARGLCIAAVPVALWYLDPRPALGWGAMAAVACGVEQVLARRRSGLATDLLTIAAVTLAVALTIVAWHLRRTWFDPGSRLLRDPTRLLRDPSMQWTLVLAAPPLAICAVARLRGLGVRGVLLAEALLAPLCLLLGESLHIRSGNVPPAWDHRAVFDLALVLPLAARLGDEVTAPAWARAVWRPSTTRA